MMRALFVALLLVCCSVCSATGAISVPVTHTTHVHALHGRRARRITSAATREECGRHRARDARKRLHWFASFGPLRATRRARLQPHASQSPRHARLTVPNPQAPAAAITAPKSKVKAVKAVDVPKGGAVLDSYQKALDDKPIFTKACTSGVGFAVSDVLTQLFIEKMDFDLKRLVKMASFGFLLHGTTGHFFYNFLDGKLKGTDPLTVAAKVAIDQTCWAPVFMVMFFSYMMVFEGTPDLIEAKIRQDVFTAVKGSWMTWIPAHTINFAFVPSDMRLLYINTIQIFFNMFMSVIGNTEAVAAE